MEERIEELIIEYLDGTISSQDQQTLDDLISEGVITRAEIEAYKKLYGSIDRIGITQPSTQMTDNFYAMLDEKIASTGPYTWLDRFAAVFYHKGISRGGLQVAYSTIVLLLGLGVGYMIIGKSDKEQLSTLSHEVREMKSMMMMSLLEKESPSERIKAVSLAQEMAAIDDKIIDALFKTLNHDANANVRLEALDALVRYASMAGVRSRLIESLQYQQSPLVQLALADIMVLLQDEEARRALQDLANDQETTDEVKLQIEDRIKAISL